MSDLAIPSDMLGAMLPPPEPGMSVSLRVGRR